MFFADQVYRIRPYFPVSLPYRYQPESLVLQGGESAGLARLSEQLSDKTWVAEFEKPKGNPALFKKPATTCLSPYMKFGCVSARLFYHKIAEVSSLSLPGFRMLLRSWEAPLSTKHSHASLHGV